MGRGNKQSDSEPDSAVQMQGLPPGCPPSPRLALLVTPGSQEAAAPEPGEEEAGRRQQSRWSQRVKDLIQKHAVLIAVICLLLVGGIGFISGVAVQGSSSPPGPPSCPPAPPSCPNKWLRSDGKCYLVSQERKYWDSSLEFCKSHGGTLLPAGNETQEIGSFYNLVGEDYWIGLKKDSVSREWRQLDGAKWSRPIAHDNSKMNCGCVNSGKYVALDCSTPRRWICVLLL